MSMQKTTLATAIAVVLAMVYGPNAAANPKNKFGDDNVAEATATANANGGNAGDANGSFGGDGGDADDNGGQVCRYLVIDFGTSQSPKSTRQRDSHYGPGRPASVPLRHTLASSVLASRHSRNGWTPRSDAIFAFPLARKRTSGKQYRLAATGVYAPSLALHGAQRMVVTATPAIARIVTNLRQSRRLETCEPLKAVIYGAT